MNKLSDDSKKSMFSRVTTGLVLAVVGVPVIVFGGWFSFIFLFLLVVLAIHEIIHAPGNRYNVFIQCLVYIAVLSFVYWTFIKTPDSMDNILKHNTFTLKTISVSTMGVTVFFLLLMLISILLEKFAISDVCYLFTMGLFLGLAFLSIYYIRFFPNNVEYYGNDLKSCLFFFYVLIGTFMSDIGAYFTGVLFGRHKMNPRISPKKTWEGFVGGIIISIAFSLGFAGVCEALGSPIIPGLFDFQSHHWVYLVLISLVMPITSNLGDFLFSAVKRNFAIKDFGTIFPGHGGVLDRLDSLLVTSIVVGIFTILISNNWSLMA